MSTLRSSTERRNIDLTHLILVSQAAALHGLCIFPDARLSRTPYIAMNPLAGKELHQPYIEGILTFDPLYEKTRRLPMDMNHELEEYLKMRAGWHYHAAHLWANRKQRTFVILSGDKSIASTLGVKFDGIQVGFRGSPDTYQFTDPHTGSTTYGRTLHGARMKLGRMRKEFRKASPQNQLSVLR